MTDVFSPGRLGPITLRNRTIKAATYENRARRGLVTDALIDFHVAYAAGGVGMTTVAYCAVSPEGRTDNHQIVWRPEALPGLRRLTDAVHAEGAAVSAQVGHSGPVGLSRGPAALSLLPRRFPRRGRARPGSAPVPPGTGRSAASGDLAALVPSRTGSVATWAARRASHADLARIVAGHGDAVRTAIDAGFDAVEIHLGHNYLASAFLSPKLNRRRDRYGGSLENRARLSREIMRAVRDAAGDRIAVLAKLNLDDGVPGGFGPDEAVVVARWLEDDGTVDALEMTAGSSLLNPMYLFKGDAPVGEFAAMMPAAVRPGVRRFGHRFLREYPYRDGYLLADAARIRAAVGLPMILLGGVTNRTTMDLALAEGFDFVAMGRALLREPDLINRIRADPGVRSLCDHNNRCMPTIFRGSRCVLAPTPD